MKEGKHAKCKFKIIEAYSVLIFIVTLFMSIGYAEISDVLLNITGTVEATVQEGVFITTISNTSGETTVSKINYFLGTMFESQIVLGNTVDSSISYDVTLYNNSDKEYIFIDTLTDTTDGTLYDNQNIEYNIKGIQKYETTIAPTQSLKFTITFKYKEGADLSQNVLNSKLNFRFKELPKLVLSNDEYTLNGIYPDYTPQEYEFTVSNYYSDTEVNTVPMNYSFVTEIDSPLTVKIFDSTGKEVTDFITISGDGQTKISNTYKLKILWDNSKTTDYNKTEYAGKQYNCSIEIKAKPVDEKYLEYVITKQLNVNITTATFNFVPNPTTANLTIMNDATTLSMTINNYSSDTNYNKFDTNYEISIQGNNDFSFSIDNVNPTNNVITQTLNGGSNISDSLSVKFMADMANLEVTETLTLKLVSKKPYIKEIEIPVTVKLHTVTVTLNANGGSVSPSTLTVYQDKTYTGLPTPTRTGHTFNGWYTSTSGGTKITNTTTVTTTSSTQTLYAQWTSRLLADKVKVGDKVNYPVNYSNVPTNSDGGYLVSTSSTYTGWRVLSIDGSGDNKYVRLITAGIPMTYVHPATSSSGSTSVTALTTNFFSTAINSTSTNYTFRRCGFKNSSGTTITSISALKTLFTNDYTQVSSGNPKVQSMTKADVDKVWGATTENGQMLTTNNLLAIPSQTSGSYAAYHLATYTTYNSLQYLWNVRYAGGIIFTNSEHGIRPVVTLKTTVETTGQTNNVWQINI